MSKSVRAATQIRLDELLFEKLKIIAESELRTLNSQMEYFLRRGVMEYESVNGEVVPAEYMLLDGLKDTLPGLKDVLRPEEPHS